MDILDDLKATWQTADTKGLPDAGAVTALAKNYRSKKLAGKTIIVTLSVALAVFFMVFMYYNRAAMATTLISYALLALCMLILAYTNLRSMRRFLVFNNVSNAQFVAFLEQTRRNQVYYYRRTQVMAMLIYSVAILLLPYQLVYKHIALAVGFYSMLVIALLIFWLVVRPKKYKNEAKKLDLMIQHAERLAQQLK